MRERRVGVRVKGWACQILPKLGSGRWQGEALTEGHIRSAEKRSRMLRGQARAGSRNDRLCRRRNVAQDLLRGHPNCLQPFGLQPRIAERIAFWPVAHVVRNPVDLDHQPRVGAVEIHPHIAAGVLTAKLHTLRLAAQQTPEQDFGQTHLLALLAGLGDATGAWLGARSLNIQCPSVSPAGCHLPETSSGRILYSQPATQNPPTACWGRCNDFLALAVRRGHHGLIHVVPRHTGQIPVPPQVRQQPELLQSYNFVPLPCN